MKKLLQNVPYGVIVKLKRTKRNTFEGGVKKMKLDRQKYDLAKARACKGQKELMAEGIPKGTLCRAANGYSLKPETAGKIAKALGVDVTEIIED